MARRRAKPNPKTKENMRLGSLIRWMRGNRINHLGYQLDQAEVAVLCDEEVGVKTLGHYEAGRRAVPFDNLITLAIAMQYGMRLEVYDQQNGTKVVHDLTPDPEQRIEGGLYPHLTDA